MCPLSGLGALRDVGQSLAGSPRRVFPAIVSRLTRDGQAAHPANMFEIELLITSQNILVKIESREKKENEARWEIYYANRV